MFEKINVIKAPLFLSFFLGFLFSFFLCRFSLFIRTHLLLLITMRKQLIPESDTSLSLSHPVHTQNISIWPGKWGQLKFLCSFRVELGTANCKDSLFSCGFQRLEWWSSFYHVKFGKVSSFICNPCFSFPIIVFNLAFLVIFLHLEYVLDINFEEVLSCGF